MRFGYHLLAWRVHGGLSQVQLAQESGLLRPYLSRLERNECDPSLSTVCRLAAALHLRPGQLIDDMPEVEPLNRDKMDSLARRFAQTPQGDHSLRKLRVELGEDQWKALLNRVGKFE